MSYNQFIFMLDSYDLFPNPHRARLNALTYEVAFEEHLFKIFPLYHLRAYLVYSTCWIALFSHRATGSRKFVHEFAGTET